MAMISRTFLSTFPETWHVHLMLLIIVFFWPVCTVIARLAKEQLEMFGLNVVFSAIVPDCGANMRKAFNRHSSMGLAKLKMSFEPQCCHCRFYNTEE